MSRALPSPILNEKETRLIDQLTERHKKMTSPGLVQKAGSKAIEAIPEPLKALGEEAKKAIDEAELYKQALAVATDGFKIIQENAARFTISEKRIVGRVNKASEGLEAESIDDFVFARSYELAKAANSMRAENLGAALIEGGATGYLGFPGIPFNLVLSTFLYFRAVQSIAMHYGYNVKEDASELVIAGDVFATALSPKSHSSANELSATLGKIMLISQAESIKQAAGKSWGHVIAQGPAGLLIAQMRALANKAAANAVQAAGKQGLEQSIFVNVFKQIGNKLPLKSVERAVPVVSSVFGALFDTAQMNTVLDYADLFYHKRFLLEKEALIAERISTE